jgi:hypothetical protein
MSTGILSMGKMAMCEVDHSSPSSAKVKNEWSLCLLWLCLSMALKFAQKIWGNKLFL